MSLKKQHYIHKIALISSLLVFLSLNCNILTPKQPEEKSLKPITLLSPTSETSFNRSNQNKLVIQYDPVVVTVPLQREFSMDEGTTWYKITADVVGDDSPISGAKGAQYYVLTWIPENNLENPPPAGSKIWIKISGYQNTSHLNHVQKDIKIE